MYGKNKTVVVGASPACPQCGAPLVGDELFCTTCGYDVSGGAVAPQPQAGSKRICETCGQPLYDGDLFCTNCGTPVSGAAPVTPPPPAQPPLPLTPPEQFGGWQGGQPGGHTIVVGDVPGNNVVPTHTVPVGMVPNDTSLIGATIVNPDDDHPTARPLLVRLTREEARNGCRKTVFVGGSPVNVTVPAGVDAYSKVDIPNMGYYDERTGVRGPLRLSFHVVRDA